MLVEAEADVNKKDYYSTTPLTRAVEFLLSKEADVNMPNFSGCTAVDLAARNGYEACLNLLIKAGVDVNYVNLTRFTTLIFVLDTCVSILLDVGADVNATDREGNIALIIASGSSVQCRVECVKLLLRSGARVNSFKNNKQNALCLFVFWII